MKKYLQELILKMFVHKCFFFNFFSKIRHFDDVIAEQVRSSKKSLCPHVPYMMGFHRGKFYHYDYTQSKVMQGRGGGGIRPPKKPENYQKSPDRFSKNHEAHKKSMYPLFIGCLLGLLHSG